MTDGALFTDLQTKAAPRRRRNSSVKPSLMAAAAVGAISPEHRGGVAQQLVRLLAALGVDRVQLSQMIGLSRSSTSHWHHGANGISRHNLAVLIDAARERAPAAIEAVDDLRRCKVTWSDFVQAGMGQEKTDGRTIVADCNVARSAAEDFGTISVSRLPVRIGGNDDAPRDNAMTWKATADGYASGPFRISRSGDRWHLRAVLPSGIEINVEASRLPDVFGAAQDIWGHE